MGTQEHAGEAIQTDRGLKGEAALRLLLDPTWILRRVESVVLRPDGQTSRRISFDFSLPRNARIASESDVSETDHGKRLAVPLTFMSKGTIVNLNVTDVSGSSLPVLGFTDNGELTREALVLLATLQKNVVIIPGDGGPGEETEAGPVSIASAKRAIEMVVYSQCKTEVADAQRDLRRMQAFQSVARREYAAATALAHDETDSDVKSLIQRLVVVHQMLNAGVVCTPADSSVTQITQDAPERAREVEIERFLLDALAALLSTVSHSYWFAVVMPLEQVSNRTIVKVSYDSDNSEFQAPARSERVWAWIARSAWPRMSTPLHFATWSAASTHLEVETTPGLEITNVAQIVRSDSVDGAPTTRLECRQANSRTHVTVQGSKQPITELVMTISPRKTGGLLHQAWLWSVVALISIFSARAVGFATWMKLDLFSSSNVIALSTLIVGLGSAVLIIDSRHQFERAVLRPPRYSLVLSLLLMLGVLAAGMGASSYPGGSADFSHASLIASIAAGGNGVWAFAMMRYSNLGAKFEKSGWKIVDRPARKDVYVQSALAVTETAAFSALSAPPFPASMDARFIQGLANRTDSELSKRLQVWRSS